jgi:hypothetical protein
MRAIYAWWLINLTYSTRPLYQALGALSTGRAYAGTNPLFTLFDGLAWVLVGLALILLPFVGVLTFPFTSFWLVCVDRSNWKQIRELTAAGRVDWSLGRIKDLPKEAAKEEVNDGEGQQ